MKKVSVIVPVYNAEKYLRECLDSLVNQTLKEIEIIVVNDGSKDNSLSILREYEKKHKDKVIVIDNKENQGIGRTRNNGLKKATGEYIGFMDSDDYADLNMYEEYYEFAKKNKLDIATGYYTKLINNNKEVFKNEYFEITNYQNNKNIINLIDYGPANKIFKNNIIRENKILFEEKLKYEDMPFVLKNVYHSNKIGHINKSLYCYRVHRNSETTTMDKRVFDMFEILNIVNRYYKVKNEEIEYLNIRQITRYMLQQKYQKDKKLKREFINKGYKILNEKYPGWKCNDYYKQENKLKRVIKNNKILLKLYCLKR